MWCDYIQWSNISFYSRTSNLFPQDVGVFLCLVEEAPGPGHTEGAQLGWGQGSVQDTQHTASTQSSSLIIRLVTGLFPVKGNGTATTFKDIFT